MTAQTRNRLWSAALWTALAAALCGIVATARAFDASILLPVMDAGETPIPAVAWYRLASDALDSSGNGYHGEWAGTEAYSGNAATFDGASYISFASVPAVPVSGGTITLWAYRDVATIGTTGLGMPNNGSTAYIYQLNATTLRLRASGAATTRDYAATSPYQVWAHYAVVCDGGSVRVYRGGVESATGAQALTGSMSIARLGAFSTAYYWIGQFRDLRMYDRALSPANIQRIMTGPDVEPIEELQ